MLLIETSAIFYFHYINHKKGIKFLLKIVKVYDAGPYVKR